MTANVMIDIQVTSDSQHLPSREDIQSWAEATVGEYRREAEISIIIMDAEESAELNFQWRQKEGPTNVLSFPSELPPGLELPLLGDLAVCAPVVEREAREQKKNLQAHWAHMIVHGTLHLLGYDHIEDEDAEKMETLETMIIQKLGFLILIRKTEGKPGV